MVLFAKEKVNEVTIDGQPLKVTYEGNKMIGIIEYEKDPSVEMGEFDVERDQLVKISE